MSSGYGVKVDFSFFAPWFRDDYRVSRNIQNAIIDNNHNKNKDNYFAIPYLVNTIANSRKSAIS